MCPCDGSGSVVHDVCLAPTEVGASIRFGSRVTGEDVGRGEPDSGVSDHEEFTRLVTPELDILYRVARTLVRRPADAEDLVQDTLLRAFRGFSGFDGAHPRAWLLTIMRNTEVNRNRRRRPSMLLDPESSDVMADTGPEGQPEEEFVGREFERAVRHALAALPEHYSQVVELIDMDGLSYGEAAHLLGIPQGTVMSRLHRARARIRKQLAAGGLAPTGDWQ